ncbi:MAG TPA: hypothetical protein VI874_05320 [Candidatus Norongarragalinales archaeon]|nr:hypothetical protein [Candidatus Norongarragalinales archaeon]
MKKRWWFWFLVWTVPFFVITAVFTPYLALGLIAFFVLHALRVWHEVDYAHDWRRFKEKLKDPQPLAELFLFGTVLLMFILALSNQPKETLIVLLALIPLLASLAFPKTS